MNISGVESITDLLILWGTVSFLIMFLWALMINDPGSSDLQNNIITIVCAILALPLTLVLAVIFFLLYLMFKYKEYKYEKENS